MEHTLSNDSLDRFIRLCQAYREAQRVAAATPEYPKMVDALAGLREAIGGEIFDLAQAMDPWANSEKIGDNRRTHGPSG